jgi:hypothetical protein
MKSDSEVEMASPVNLAVNRVESKTNLNSQI